MLQRSAEYNVTYAVGDIHGRLDLLDLALGLIEQHARGLDSRIVFLGDYIDRGPSSRGVLERLIALQKDAPTVCLKGNHEDLMVRTLTDFRAKDSDLWLDCGGLETLRSYGLALSDTPAHEIPRSHVRWLASLPLTTADADRIYVHGGLAPRTPFAEQKEASLLWIRDAFLKAGPADFDAHVVHGHTPLWAGKPDPSLPERLAHRTNLDTAAFASGVLSIGVFETRRPGGPVEILSARGDPVAHPLREVAGPAGPAIQPRARAAARPLR